MSRPTIIPVGSGRLIINEMPDLGCASVMIDVNGAGPTILPNKKQCIQAAAALMQAAKRMP